MNKNDIEITNFDFSKHLQTPEDIAAYLTACAEEGEELFFAALGDVAKSIGMTTIAKKSKLDRAGLYRAFNENSKNTQYATVSKVLKAMNFRIKVEPIY